MRFSLRTVAAIVAAAALFVASAGVAEAQDKPPATKKPPVKEKKKPATADTPSSEAKGADEAAIRQGAEAFVTAYNAHDAEAVSELYALKAEFTDEAGNLIKGRKAIEQDFGQMFTEHPQTAIEVAIDSIRFLTPNIAIEEGTVHGRPEPDEGENVSSYIAIHVKVEGRWLIASVRDFEAEPEAPTANEQLQELAWMVGDWIDESSDSVVKSSCRWDDSGNYLLHEFVLHLAGGAASSGSMRIGKDPLSGQIKSWTFDADSGYSEGLWTKAGDEWVVKAHGVNGEGKVTSSTNVYRFVDEDTMTWRSYDRVVDGEPAADVAEFVVKRQAPLPEE